MSRNELIRRLQSRSRLFCVVLMAIVLAAGVGRASAATLVADYLFQDTYTSSVGTPPVLTDLGPGTNSFATETVDGAARRVLTFPQGNGLSLSPTTSVISNDSYTVVLLFRFADVTGFRRILDFKNGSSDCGLYVFSGKLDFFCDEAGINTPIAANTYVQVVLTRDNGTNTVIGYVDGVMNISFTDTPSDAVVGTNNILRFFRDNECVAPCNEDAAGAVARIRLYDGPLTTEEVAALDRRPAVPLDHFQCYKTKATKGNLCEPTAMSNPGGTCVTEEDCGGIEDVTTLCLPNKFPKGVRVSLSDQLEPGPRVFDVKKPVDLCAPADKNGEGINDPVTHLEGYQIALTKGQCAPGSPSNAGKGCLKEIDCGGTNKVTTFCAVQAKSVAQLGLQISNQFHSLASPLVVDTINPDRLLVPTAKSLTGPPLPLGANDVDHYKCYTIKVSKGQPKFATIPGVLVQDQFTSGPRAFDLTKPTRFCTPVDKNGEGIKHADADLLCYQVKLSKGLCAAVASVNAGMACAKEDDCGGTKGQTTLCVLQPKFQALTGIFVNNQLDAGPLDTLKEDEFCVPSKENSAS